MLLGGLLQNIHKDWFMGRSVLTGTDDCNNIDECGTYRYFLEDGIPKNSPGYQRCVICSFVSSGFKVQIGVDMVNSGMKIRSSQGSTWNSWI